MKTKVCPYCDQPIQGVYCKGCKRVVLHPVEYDMTYYLNERHPENEEHCSYHGEVTRNTSDAGKDWKPKTTSKNSGAGKKIFWMILIYIITMLGGGLITWSISGISGIVRQFSGTGVYEIVREPESESAWEWSAEVTPEKDVFYEWERSAEEVRALGEACTGYGHFSVIYGEEDGPEQLKQLLATLGLRVWEENVYSSNYDMTYDSWYQTVYEYTIETDEEYIGTIEIDTDTATGQIHGFSMYSTEEDYFYELAYVVLNYIEETGIVEEPLPQGADFYKELSVEHNAELREQGFVMMYGLESYCYLTGELESDFYSMTLNAPGYRTEK